MSVRPTLMVLLLVSLGGSVRHLSGESLTPSESPPGPARHVLLVGLDGARADAIRDHAGPALRSLIDSGSSCWETEATVPSVTQVNWASILTGSTPSRHGIDRHPIKEEELGRMPLRVPTLFDQIAEHGYHAAGFFGHWKVYPSESRHPNVHIERSSYESARVASRAADYISQHRPIFTFVYMGDLDGLGHRHGWMSPGYIAGIVKIDRALQVLLDALERAGIRDQTLIVIISDHGGRGRSHSETSVESTQVPLIVAGPGIRAGSQINDRISVTQVAPTILHWLGVPRPSQWNGSVIHDLHIKAPSPQSTLATQRTALPQPD